MATKTVAAISALGQDHSSRLWKPQDQQCAWCAVGRPVVLQARVLQTRSDVSLQGGLISLLPEAFEALLGVSLSTAPWRTPALSVRRGEEGELQVIVALAAQPMVTEGLHEVMTPLGRVVLQLEGVQDSFQILQEPVTLEDPVLVVSLPACWFERSLLRAAWGKQIVMIREESVDGAAWHGWFGQWGVVVQLEVSVHAADGEHESMVLMGVTFSGSAACRQCALALGGDRLFVLEAPPRATFANAKCISRHAFDAMTEHGLIKYLRLQEDMFQADRARRSKVPFSIVSALGTATPTTPATKDVKVSSSPEQVVTCLTSDSHAVAAMLADAVIDEAVDEAIDEFDEAVDGTAEEDAADATEKTDGRTHRRRRRRRGKAKASSGLSTASTASGARSSQAGLSSDSSDFGTFATEPVVVRDVVTLSDLGFDLGPSPTSKRSSPPAACSSQSVLSSMQELQHAPAPVRLCANLATSISAATWAPGERWVSGGWQPQVWAAQGMAMDTCSPDCSIMSTSPLTGPCQWSTMGTQPIHGALMQHQSQSCPPQHDQADARLSTWLQANGLPSSERLAEQLQAMAPDSYED